MEIGFSKNHLVFSKSLLWRGQKWKNVVPDSHSIREGKPKKKFLFLPLSISYANKCSAVLKAWYLRKCNNKSNSVHEKCISCTWELYLLNILLNATFRWHDTQRTYEGYINTCVTFIRTQISFPWGSWKVKITV